MLPRPLVVMSHAWFLADTDCAQSPGGRYGVEGGASVAMERDAREGHGGGDQEPGDIKPARKGPHRLPAPPRGDLGGLSRLGLRPSG